MLPFGVVVFEDHGEFYLYLWEGVRDVTCCIFTSIYKEVAKAEMQRLSKEYNLEIRKENYSFDSNCLKRFKEKFKLN